jgi:hypothetical protein
MFFHFCVKATNTPRLANSSNLTELKYSEVPSACISNVQIYKKARLKKPSHLFTPSHFGLAELRVTASGLKGSGTTFHFRLKKQICVCLKICHIQFMMDKKFINPLTPELNPSAQR